MVVFLSLEDILDRVCSKFKQGLENCQYDIKTQKYRRIIHFFL